MTLEGIVPRFPYENAALTGCAGRVAAGNIGLWAIRMRKRTMAETAADERNSGFGSTFAEIPDHGR